MRSIPDPECPHCGSYELHRAPEEEEEQGADYECQSCGGLSEHPMGSGDVVPHRPRDLAGGMLISELLAPDKPRIQRVFHDRRG